MLSYNRQVLILKFPKIHNLQNSESETLVLQVDKCAEFLEAK